MNPFIISQIIAACALGAGLLSFQLKKREHVLGAFALMSALFSLHFYVLGETTAAAVVAVSVVRFITSIFCKHKAFMYLFIVLTIAVGWFTYEAWYNLVAIAAALLGVVATFQQNDKRLREIMMSSNVTMAVHDLIVMTPVGIAVDCTIMISNVIGYIRFYGGRGKSEF